jgi:hypothetical protein
MGRRTARALGIAALVVAAACQPGWTPLAAGYQGAFITPEGKDVFGLTVAGTAVTMKAPTTNTGGNTRAVFWREGAVDTADQEVCATWVSHSGVDRQEGVALRVRSAQGRTRAITVTNNVVYGARWGFNVHVMDSGSSTPHIKIGGFLLEEVFRPDGPGTTRLPPHPWRMCARVVGSVVSFIVWPTTHAEPAWDDARYGGSVTLPTGWTAVGKPGWYAAHLRPGESMVYDDLTTRAMTGTAAAEPTVAPRAPTRVLEAP